MLSQDSKFPPFPTTSPQKWIFFFFLVPRNFLNGKVNENLTLLSDSESFFLVCFFIFLSNQKDHDNSLCLQEHEFLAIPMHAGAITAALLRNARSRNVWRGHFKTQLL